VGSVRREILDRILIINAAHLRKVLAEYETYFNTCRPHRSLTRPARYGHFPIQPMLISRSSDMIGSVVCSMNTRRSHSVAEFSARTGNLATKHRELMP